MEVSVLWRNQDDVQLVDVREDSEWSTGHIPGSIHIPLNRLAEQADRLDGDRRVVAVCRTGPRSERAVGILQARGFAAVHLVGGVSAWRKHGHPLVDAAGNPGSVEGDDDEPMSPELEEFQNDFVEISLALQERFGGREPSEEESRAFMREWLEGKGTPAEEIERILED